MPRLVHSRLLPATLAAVVLPALLAPAPRARADFADYDVSRARLAVQRSSYLLDDAEYAADVARDDFARADARAADLARQIDLRQRDLDDASRRFDEAARSAKWLRDDLARSTERLDARRKELDAATERVRAARDAVTRLTADEVARFESSDPYKQLKAAADEAGKALGNAEKASLDAFAKNDERRAAQTAVDAINTRVQFLTEQGDRAARDELDAAKKELAAAQDRLRRLEDRHLSDDPAVKAAEQKLNDADRAARAAHEDFDRQIGQRPDVADARKAVASAEQAYDDALRAVRDAESRVADAQDQLTRQDEVAALEQDKLKAGNDELNHLLDEVREADSFAAASDARLRDALESLDCARRERDAAAWSLARAERAADAFYCWDTPATGFGWTVVHVGLVDCQPSPVFYDPWCYRPAWCRPLTDFRGPRWGWGGAWGAGFWHGAGHPGPWRDDLCRPVVVKVVRVHNPSVARVVETSRAKAVRLASLTPQQQQEIQQRRALVEQTRQEVKQRDARLAAFGPMAGTPGAAAIAIKQSNAIERQARQRQLAADQARAGESRRAVDVYNQQLRQRQQADAAQSRGQVAAVAAPGAGIDIRPTRQGNNTAPDGRRLRWAERRELEQQQQQARAAALTGNPAAAAAAVAAETHAQRPAQANSSDPRQNRDAMRTATTPPASALPDAARQITAADQTKSAGQSAVPDAAQRRVDQRVEQRAAQQQKDPQEDALREARQAAKLQDDQVRRQAARAAEAERQAERQTDRQQDADARLQRQAEDAARQTRETSRDAARQQVAAEERSRRAADRDATESARAAQRESSRAAEQQRSAEREAARNAERAQRQAESDARQSQRNSDSSSSNNSNSTDRYGDSGTGRRR